MKEKGRTDGQAGGRENCREGGREGGRKDQDLLGRRKCNVYTFSLNEFGSPTGFLWISRVNKDYR